MNNKKTFLAILFLVVLTVVVSALGSLVPFSAKNEVVAQETPAIPDRDVTGYAWSSNIGWISFNGANYGVTLKSGGDLTGYAWANPRDAIGPDGDQKFNNIGWIKFDPDSPYPGDPDHSAQVNEITGAVTGWIRACAAAPDPIACTGVGSNGNANDWDGWIKLSGNKANGTPWTEPVSVVFEADKAKGLTGYAWGSEVMGWIDFDPDFSGVDIEDPNTKDLAVNCYPTNANSGQIVLSGPSVTVNWTADLLKNGIPDYTYTWESSALTPNPTVGSPTPNKAASITATYNSLGVKMMKVTVADENPNQQPVSKTCSVEVVANITPPPPPPGGVGSLIANDNVVYISEQASGHSAETIVRVSKPGAEITNNSAADSVISALRITSIESTKSSRELQDILDDVDPNDQDDLIKYSFSSTPGNDRFSSSPASLSIERGESAYFRLQVPFYHETIAANSPYKIIISGNTVDSKGTPDPADDETVTVSVPILFNYLVGTYIQQ